MTAAKKTVLQGILWKWVGQVSWQFIILTKNKFWDLIIVIIGSDQPHEQEEEHETKMAEEVSD